MTCLEMCGNGQKLQPIPTLLMWNRVERYLSVVEVAGGMRPRTVVFHDDTPLTTPRKRVDWD